MFDLITVENLALQLKTAESTIYGWVTNKKIPTECIFDKLGGIRIRKNKFEEFYNIELENLLTPEELAEILSIKKHTLPIWFTRNVLPKELKIKIVGLNRYKKNILEKFLNGDISTVA